MHISLQTQDFIVSHCIRHLPEVFDALVHGLRALLMLVASSSGSMLTIGSLINIPWHLSQFVSQKGSCRGQSHAAACPFGHYCEGVRLNYSTPTNEMNQTATFHALAYCSAYINYSLHLLVHQCRLYVGLSPYYHLDHYSTREPVFMELWYPRFSADKSFNDRPKNR